MSLELIIGYIGCAAISSLQFPQVYYTFRTKKADDLSWFMIYLHLFSSIIWLFYGYLLYKFPIIISNCIYFIGNILLIILKYKFTNKNNSLELNRI